MLSYYCISKAMRDWYGNSYLNINFSLLNFICVLPALIFPPSISMLLSCSRFSCYTWPILFEDFSYERWETYSAMCIL